MSLSREYPESLGEQDTDLRDDPAYEAWANDYDAATLQQIDNDLTRIFEADRREAEAGRAFLEAADETLNAFADALAKW